MDRGTPRGEQYRAVVATDEDLAVIGDALEALWHSAPARRREIERTASLTGIQVPAPVDDLGALVPA